MAEFIHEHSTRLKDEDGTAYVVRIYARQRTDGTWEGWLEFHPTDERKSVLRTEQETSQPNRIAVEYWASGLEPIYLEGALRTCARTAAVRPRFSHARFSSVTETSRKRNAAR